MIDRTTKLRWRRRFKSKKRQVEDLGVQAEEQLEQHFFKRLSRLTQVRRFVAAWVLLLVLLTGGVLAQARGLGNYYLANMPTKGGIYTEGIVGSFTNANPLYSANSVDASVERLVFSGLFKFDVNNHLAADLADNYQVDERGTTYTVKLKNNLTWHDGHALTAADVAFTYQTIQNPDAKSPLAASWKGITVTAIDNNTVTFELPSVLTAFPYSMTNGIVPKHLLDGIPPSQLRSISFNTSHPIGSGPFKWEAVESIDDSGFGHEQRIALLPNVNYQGGAPKLDKFILRAFKDDTALLSAFKKRELTAAAGLTSEPADVAKDSEVQDFTTAFTSAVYTFFKTSSEPFVDFRVRQALVLASDPGQIVARLSQPAVLARSPLLPGQIGYDKTLLQTTNNRAAAIKLLEDAGWKLNDKNVRVKDGKELIFRLSTQNNTVYGFVSQMLKTQWAAIGVKVDILPQTDNELQSSITFHTYDALLYGIELGPDPDVFAYWHSSQADLRSPTRLNFSEYRSPVADKSLEAGRTRTDPGVRAVKYKPFLEAWRNDAPALALYQPRYLYLVRGPISGYSQTSLNSAADRFNNVQNWQIREQKQAITQ